MGGAGRDVAGLAVAAAVAVAAAAWLTLAGPTPAADVSRGSEEAFASGLQRRYVEIWVDALRKLRPDLTEEAARVAAHGTFGLLNSTPHTGRGPEAVTLLRHMAITALLALPPSS